MALSNRWVWPVFWLRFAPKRRLNKNSSQGDGIQNFCCLIAVYHARNYNKHLSIIIFHQHHSKLHQEKETKQRSTFTITLQLQHYLKFVNVKHVSVVDQDGTKVTCLLLLLCNWIGFIWIFHRIIIDNNISTILFLLIALPLISSSMSLILQICRRNYFRW